MNPNMLLLLGLITCSICSSFGDQLDVYMAKESAYLNFIHESEAGAPESDKDLEKSISCETYKPYAGILQFRNGQLTTGKLKYVDPACDPGDPFPIGNINLNKIKGAWFAQYIKPPKGFPMKNVLTSFRLIIKPVNSDNATGTISGRSINDCGCTESDLFLNSTGKKNAFIEYSDFAAASGVQTEWRFLDIYKDYLLAIACLRFDKFERCESSFIEIFSRNNDPIPLPALKRLNQSARKTLCLDIFESLMEWSYGNCCP